MSDYIDIADTYEEDSAPVVNTSVSEFTDEFDASTQEMYDGRKWESFKANTALGVTEPLLNLSTLATKYSIPNLMFQARQYVGGTDYEDLVGLEDGGVLRSIPSVSKFEKDMKDNALVYGDILNGDKLGQPIMRHLPSLIAGFKVPMSAYTTPIRLGNSMVIPSGFVAGGFESNLYSLASSGSYEDTIDPISGETIPWYSQASTDFGIGSILGGGIGYYGRNKDDYYKYPKEAYSREGRVNNYARDNSKNSSTSEPKQIPMTITVSNDAANDIGTTAIATGVVAATLVGGSYQDAEASAITETFMTTNHAANFIKTMKSSTQSSAAAQRVLHGNIKTVEEAQAKDYDNLWDKSTGIIKDVGKTQSDEFSRVLDDGSRSIDEGVQNIISESHKEVKQVPIEYNSFINKIVDENFPITTEGNPAIRNSLGLAYKTGADNEDLMSLITSRADYKRDIYSSLEYISPNVMKKIEDATDAMATRTINQEVSPVIASNPNELISTLGLSKELSSTKRAIKNLAVMKAFDKLSKETIDNVSDSLIRNTQATMDIFATRGLINRDTSELIGRGDLSSADEIFGYTRPVYNNKADKIIMTAEEFNTFKMIDDTKQKLAEVMPWLKRDRDIISATPSYKYIHGETGELIPISQKETIGMDKDSYLIEYEVLARQSDDGFAQGALPVQSKVTRGLDRKVYSPQNRVLINGEDLVERLMYEGFPVNKILVAHKDEKLRFTGANDVMTVPEYKSFRKANARQKHDAFIYSIKKPLSPEEKALLDESDDIADVASSTVSAVKMQLAKSNMYTKIRLENVYDLDKADSTVFLNDARTSPKALFIKLEDKSRLEEPALLQFITNNYATLTDKTIMDATGATYVNNQYINDLFGFNKLFISEGKYGLARASEDILKSLVGVFRSSVILKNPVAFVNNAVGMSFTNFAVNYIKYGNLNMDAFSGLVSANAAYKDFVAYRTAHIQASIRGEDTKFLDESMQDNPAYLLWKHGGLQSLIDDGLMDKTLAEAKNVEDGYSKSGLFLRNVALSEDTVAGNAVRGAFDQTDIINRVNLFTILKQNGLDDTAAALETGSISVNYSRLLSPSMMFVRDTGIVPFATWFSKMIPVMTKLIRDNPRRFAMLQGMYLGMMYEFGEESYYGDDYMFGVRVESYNPFNALAPDNLADPLSPAYSSGRMQLAPVYLDNIVNGKAEKTFGFTTR